MSYTYQSRQSPDNGHASTEQPGAQDTNKAPNFGPPEITEVSFSYTLSPEKSAAIDDGGEEPPRDSMDWMLQVAFFVRFPVPEALRRDEDDAHNRYRLVISQHHVPDTFDEYPQAPRDELWQSLQVYYLDQLDRCVREPDCPVYQRYLRMISRQLSRMVLRFCETKLPTIDPELSAPSPSSSSSSSSPVPSSRLKTYWLVTGHADKFEPLVTFVPTEGGNSCSFRAMPWDDGEGATRREFKVGYPGVDMDFAEFERIFSKALAGVPPRDMLPL